MLTLPARIPYICFSNYVVFVLVVQQWESLASKVQNILKDYPTLSLTHGRKVLEVRPAIAWDKGKAVDYLLNSLGTYNLPADVQYRNEYSISMFI